ncbi:hypothetical protein F444_13597 [Phytophthora nicotianae P1976]|uniref:Aquaporin n=1 Tax=Phytophthora nicotianae P1976 TaxID=1317066 RepID=A0A080ZTB1_PHYNI|nr:hypothetical protein F444_13597 [Phytophthora nicotianae P1976]
MSCRVPGYGLSHHVRSWRDRSKCSLEWRRRHHDCQRRLGSGRDAWHVRRGQRQWCSDHLRHYCHQRRVRPYAVVEGPWYMVAQILGAFVGAALIYVLNAQKIRREDPNQETMYRLFITYARDGVSNYTAFYTEVLACACIMLASYAIKDRRNRWPGNRGTPFALALLVTAISCAFSSNSGLGISPNRDFGPRLFTYIIGYHMVFTEDSHYFWIPIVAPLIGGIIGGGLYILFVETQHPELPQKSTSDRERVLESV